MEDLIAFVRGVEAEEAAASPRFEWVDSARLRALVPGGDSAESKLPRKVSLLVRAAARAEPSTTAPPRRALRPTLAVVGLALGLAAVLGPHAPTRERIAAPASLVGTERWVSPRFTGGLSWAPVAVSWPPHLARELYLGPAAARYVAAAERRRGAVDEPTTGELGALGAVYALGGRGDSAVEALRRAAAAEPDSPELLSDLGAALLARAELGERRRLQDPGAEMEDHDADLPAALEAIDRALEISPRLPEALFNRALALERLYLRRSALAAWQAYLDVDDRGAWAREARERMAAIVIPVRSDPRRIRAEIAAVADGSDRERLAGLVESQRHLARVSVQEDLLPGWAEAWTAGDRDGAERQLAAARIVADEWEAQTTDATLREAVEEVESASSPVRARLAEG
ncbi:MAG TPA: tetratricopeptide repeat protein, partial [Thermoanaerobaculia bacterium]|nr:tetratricopeptide repeat protein [Thermoanaerobaculia bacterium]